MKKFLCLFGALILTITSCSSNDDDSGKTKTAILPKTVKYTNPAYPEENNTATFTYDGNKIVSIVSNNNKTEYTYDGNKIIKEADYDIVDSKATKTYEVVYSYNLEKLTSVAYAENFTSQFPTGQYKGRSVYTYNTDGTINKESYSTNATTGIETKNSYLEVLTFQNGNLIKKVDSQTASEPVYVTTRLYEYDTNNNPSKNILGFSLLLDQDEADVNNLLKHTDTSTSGTYVYKTTYEYNSDGYPTKKTEFRTDGTTINSTTEYTY